MQLSMAEAACRLVDRREFGELVKNLTIGGADQIGRGCAMDKKKGPGLDQVLQDHSHVM